MFVESVISAYDLIKSKDRANLSQKTLNDYLMIKLNMPCMYAYSADIDITTIICELRAKGAKPVNGSDKTRSCDVLLN